MESRGTYTLIMQLEQDKKLRIGAIGEIYFDKGYFAYTGSALGKGGFSRVKRHLEVASGNNKTRKWHIDYLLPHIKVVDIVTSARPECSVAVKIDGVLARVQGFGSSDCNCPSHLHYSSDAEVMKKVVRDAHMIK